MLILARPAFAKHPSVRRQQMSAGDVEHDNSRFRSLTPCALNGARPRWSDGWQEALGVPTKPPGKWLPEWSTKGFRAHASRLSVRVGLQQDQEHDSDNRKVSEGFLCPFQARDCHIRNHSPPTIRNATSHMRSEEVRASNGRDLAALNEAAGSRRARINRSAPQQSRIAVNASQAMMLR